MSPRKPEPDETRGTSAPTNGSFRAEAETDSHGRKKLSVRVPGWIAALVLTGAGIGTGGAALGAKFGGEPAPAPAHVEDSRIVALEVQQRADGKRLDKFDEWLTRVEKKLDDVIAKKKE